MQIYLHSAGSPWRHVHTTVDVNAHCAFGILPNGVIVWHLTSSRTTEF